MAKVKVYNRLPQALKFTFQGYVGEGAATEVEPENDEKTVILNGANEVVNHVLIYKNAAVTVFGYPKHDLAARTYTTEDLERLKTDPTFQKMLKNGDVAFSMDDVSTDLTGVGKMTDKELKERLAAKKDGSEGLTIGTNE